MQTRINGGSRETDVKELTVSPQGTPSVSTIATTVTPVGKRRMTLRKSPALARGFMMSLVGVGPASTRDGGPISGRTRGPSGPGPDPGPSAVLARRFPASFQGPRRGGAGKRKIDPKALMRRHFLAIAVILTLPTGCDNVAWGGMDLTVESPAGSSGEAADTATVAETAPDPATGAATPTAPNPGSAEPADAPPAPTTPPPGSPSASLVLAGVRIGSSFQLAPVGQLSGGRVTALPAPGDPAHAPVLAALAPGTVWDLYAAGGRVGTARAVRTEEDAQLCGTTRTLVASPTLAPEATGVERVIALSASSRTAGGTATYRPLAHNYEQRFASLELGRAAISRVGAPWPPDGMIPVRRDIRSFRPLGDPTPSFAVSFVVGDTLDTSAPGPNAYALFLLAAPVGDEFRERFLWYRAGADGKAAPHLFDHLDLNGDGRGEVLLEVFGQGRRGFVVLDRADDGAWREGFRSACPHLAGGVTP